MTTPTSTPEPDPAARFRHLPEPVDPSQYVTTFDTEPVPDPDGGRDAEGEWVIRHA